MRLICHSTFIWFTILCLIFLSCKKTAEENISGGFILGFSQIGAESAWRYCNTRSVQEAAAQAGVQLLYFNAEQKQENQIRAIRSFIAYQVDVIAFVPIVSDGWEHVLEEARDAGIPVLICDREINIHDESLYAGYIGTNSLQQGRRAAEFLVRKFSPSGSISENSQDDEEEEIRDSPVPEAPQQAPETPLRALEAPLRVRIVELTGTEGSSVATKRALGFREVLEEHHIESENPVFEIIHSESGDFMRSKGYELMSSILDKFDEIDVVYSHNDSMTLGAIDAMKERDIKPGVDIVIVTIDAEQAVINALIRGEVNCVVECNPMQGPDILWLASNLARGVPIPRITYMHEVVFSEGDDLLGLPLRGY